MHSLFLDAYNVSIDLVSDYYLHECRNKIAIRPEKVTEETALALKENKLFKCQVISITQLSDSIIFTEV